MSLGRRCTSLPSKVSPCLIATNACCNNARSRDVRVHVPGRDRRYRQPAREALAGTVAELVATSIGALQLDPQPLRTERVEQPPCGGLVFDAVFRTARQADEALGVVQDLLERNGRLTRMAIDRVTRVRVRAREQPAEIAPTPDRRGRAMSGDDAPRSERWPGEGRS